MRVNGIGLYILGVHPRVNKTIVVKEADFCVWIHLAELHENVVVEGGVKNSPLHAHFAFQLDELVPNAVVDHNVAFDFHIHKDVGIFHKPVYLTQRGNAGIGVVFVAVGEAELFQLLASHIHNASLAVGGAVHGFVVDHHEFSIRAFVHIKLNAVHAHFKRHFECGNCVFRRVCARSPVRPYLGCHVRSPYSMFRHFLPLYHAHIWRENPFCIKTAFLRSIHLWKQKKFLPPFS